MFDAVAISDIHLGSDNCQAKYLVHFLAALPSMKRQAYRLVPATRRERVQLLTDEILTRIGDFVSGALTVASIDGVTSYVFLTVIEMPYALALALFVALLDLVPLVGATIAAVVVSLIGLTESLGVAITCVIFYVAYQQFENYVIYPRVMRRAVDRNAMRRVAREAWRAAGLDRSPIVAMLRMKRVPQVDGQRERKRVARCELDRLFALLRRRVADASA